LFKIILPYSYRVLRGQGLASLVMLTANSLQTTLFLHPESLPNLPIIFPEHKLHKGPLHGGMPNRPSPEEQWNEEEQTSTGYPRHGTERGCVSGLFDPGVCIEREEETEAGFLH
jgi:hypothetical protein